MKFFTVPALLVAALFSVMASLPFLPLAKPVADFFQLELRMTSTVPGAIQIFYDIGQGINEDHSLRANAAPSIDPVTYRLPLRPATYRSLRLDLLDRGGTLHVAALRIVTQSGRVAHDFPPATLKAAVQIESLTPRDGGVQIVIPPGSNDPQLELAFDPPLVVQPSWRERLDGLFPRAALAWLGIAVLLLALDRRPGLRQRLGASAQRWSGQPARAVWAVAALAAIASAYPVVFLGKSYVAPFRDAPLLYDAVPTLPGGDVRATDAKGSDIGAVMWEHVPFSVLEHRALARDRELPLWDRYNSAGTPLLGQGQSMLGDPLHLIPIVAKGAAWAWDLKYLLAKACFAAGLGLLVLALARHLPAALAVTAAAPFIGFYLYRINHPAIFSLGHGPWVLLCWIRAAQARTRRETTAWAAGLVLANTALMNSGTVKEAYMLLASLSFSGACVLLAQPAPWRERARKFAILAWSIVVFALLTAPLWLTFLEALRGAYTAYNTPAAYQIQPSLLLGAFDELFYRPLTARHGIFNPALNFLLLLGLLYFLATAARGAADRSSLALAGSALLPFGLAFGIVPASWITRVPFLANVTHVDNTFTCVLLVLGSVLAGAGFARAAARLGGPEGRGDLVVAGSLLAALVALWLGFRQAVHRSVLGAEMPTFAPVQTRAETTASPFIWASLALLLLAAIALAWVLRRSLRQGRLTAAGGLTIALCAALMLWRQALHSPTAGFADYVVRPAQRPDFAAPSAAVGWLQQAHGQEPGRAMGLRGNFFPGWTGMYGLETIHGPDPIVNPFYRELIAGSGLTMIWDWRLHLTPDQVRATRPFLDFLNVRHYLHQPVERTAMTAVLPLVQRADLDIYESASAWPRAFFTDRIDTYGDAAGLVRKIATGNGRPFVALAEGDPTAQPALAGLPRDATERIVTPATDYRLTENTTSFTVRASGPGMVALQESFWPGSVRATLNGRKVAVLRINHAFCGVAIETAGEHRLEFRYAPPHFGRHLLLGGIGGVLLAGSLFLGFRRRDESES